MLYNSLCDKLASSPPSSIHRIVIPSFLTPTIYHSSLCQPSESVGFMQAIRALLRQFESRLTAMISLQTALFPRTSSLTWWMENLCDGALELVALPSRQATSDDADKTQGLVHVFKLPIFSESGRFTGQPSSIGENLGFSLSSSKGLIIKPYSLPPLEDEASGKSPAPKDRLDF